MKRDVLQLERQIDSLTAENQAAHQALREEQAATRSLLEKKLDALTAELTTTLQGAQRDLARLQELSGQGYQSLLQIRKEMAQAQAHAALSSPVPSDSNHSLGAAKPCPPRKDAEPILRITRELVRQRNPAFSSAREGASEYIRCFPQEDGVAEAKLLYAETFALERKTDEALRAYAAVVTGHPKSPLASTALFRQGMLEMERKAPQKAKPYFERILSEYPKSDEARIAEASLKKIP